MDWEFTRALSAEQEADRTRPDDDEDLSLGYAYWRALLAESGGAEELAPGVLYFPKSQPGKWL